MVCGDALLNLREGEGDGRLYLGHQLTLDLIDRFAPWALASDTVVTRRSPAPGVCEHSECDDDTTERQHFECDGGRIKVKASDDQKLA